MEEKENTTPEAESFGLKVSSELVETEPFKHDVRHPVVIEPAPENTETIIPETDALVENDPNMMRAVYIHLNLQEMERFGEASGEKYKISPKDEKA